MMRAFHQGLTALGIAALCAPAWAVQCNVNVQGISFGAYDTFDNQGRDSTANIGVNCDVAIAYAIALSPGSDSYASRSMTSGADRLRYNLYTDASRTTVWGDGTSGSLTVAGFATPANHVVYGRIPARQNVRIGNYSDNITVTVTY